MSLEQYVEKNISNEALKLLKAMRTGGDNNAKGNAFERHFSAHKVIEAWAGNREHLASTDIEFTMQEFGFVDDLAIRYEGSSPKKINYQAKNSTTNAGAYTKKIHQRFKWQEKIDQDFLGIHNTQQVLLVSSLSKFRANEKSIKRFTKGTTSNFKGEFFPYESDHQSLFSKSDDLRTNLGLICSKSDLSSLDYGFRLVLAAMEGGKSFTLKSVVEKVREMAKPDLFRDSVEDVVVPEWLKDLSKPWTDIIFVVKSREFYMTCNGLEIRLSREISEPTLEQLEKINTRADLFRLLMELASQEFTAQQAQEE